MPAFEVDYTQLSEAMNQLNTLIYDVPPPPRPRDARGRFVSTTRPFRPSCGQMDCPSCPDADGFRRDGFNRVTGLHRNGTAYDDEGYNRRGYDRSGRDREGFDIYEWNTDGYNRRGFDSYGYDREGYDARGFDAVGRHRNGTQRDGGGYDRYGMDEDGRDEDGYDSYGYDENGRNRSGYDRDGYDEDGYDEDGYDSDGQDRYGDYRDDGQLHNYSYTPRLEFRGDKGPYFGMELEVTADRIGAVVRTTEAHAGSLIYCKEDGSVAGAELVTHPMSYEWAMENFPWQLLTALRDETDADIVAQENGIHIHVSRDGFSNAAHTYRWLKFWYRNPRDIQRIARRRASTWAQFNPEQRDGQFMHAKQGKPGYNPSEDTARQGRYAAINCSNEATLEVRVFASTLRPQRAQAALQLVAATVEYTRSLTADDVCHRHGWDWSAFMAWTRKSGKYGALVAEDRIRRYL